MSTPPSGTPNATEDGSLSATNRLFEAARSARRLPPWGLVLLMAAVFLVGFIIVSILLRLALYVLLPVPLLFMDDPLLGMDDEVILGSQTPTAFGFFLMHVLQFAPLYLFVALWVRHYEGRSFRSVGFLPGGAAKKFIRGAVLGLLFVAAQVGILALLGELSPRPVSVGQVGLPALGGVLLVGVGFLVQGPAEEVLTRGWMLGSIGARYGLVAGVSLNSIVFAFAHIRTLSQLDSGPAVMALINYLLIGVFLSVYALREGSIWGVCAFHWLFNWSLTNLFGVVGPGEEPEGGSLLVLQVTAPDFLIYGVSSLVVSVGIVAVLLFWGRRRVITGGMAR